MPFYEIVYEPGTKSVAFYEDDEEAMSALSAHYARATSGEPATPSESGTHPSPDAPTGIGTWAAERPVKVFVYNEHPADFGVTVDDAQARALLDEALTATESAEGQVDVAQLAANVRNLGSPLAENPGPQDSQYKAPEERELDLSSLGGAST